MSETKRHPQHPGGAWPLNVEYRNLPIVTVMAEHPDDVAELQAKFEARAKAQRDRELAADDAIQDADDAIVKSAKSSTGKSK